MAWHQAPSIRASGLSIVVAHAITAQPLARPMGRTKDPPPLTPAIDADPCQLAVDSDQRSIEALAPRRPRYGGKGFNALTRRAFRHRKK